MKFMDLAAKAGLVSTEEEETPKPAPQVVDRRTEQSRNSQQPSSQPPQNSVAAILLSRRTTPEPASSPIQASSVITTSATATAQKTAAALDAGIVAHFMEVADGSQVLGYKEFLKQWDTLKRYITDPAALCAAAIESCGFNAETVLRAIEDRLSIVRAEKDGSLTALDHAKRVEVAANETRIQEIGTAIQQLEAEIAERRANIGALNTEKGSVSSKLAATNQTFQHDADTIRVAADAVITQLTEQATKLRSQKG